MTRYISIRVIWIFIMLTMILTVNFVLLKLAPAYPPTTEEQRDIYFNKQVSDGYMTFRIIDDPEEMEKVRYIVATGSKVRNSYYEDKGDFIRAFEPVPIAEQYFSWVKNIVTKWDWGLSTRVEVGRPVFDIIKDRIPTTMTLNIVALFIYFPIGIALGIIAALKKNKPTDNVISVAVMVMRSIPSFVIIIMLVMVLAYGLGWLPTIYPSADADLGLKIRGLVIPVLASVFAPIAALTRLTRAELTEILTSEFLLLARTKGLTRRQAIVKHGLRNSMVPLVPSIIGSFIGILSGSVILEMIYSIPGTGQVFIRALTKNAYDYNLLLCSTAFYTSITLFAVLLVDLTYGLIDPRIRIGGKY
ncbi:Oligopeptide transport system permease protein oppB [Proteiniborus sp. DW1]|uniref:ABC transporter permease n=1 Tax=Proteiniborus sp. DW1 TaxID=1889883 RepID=UPI00092DF385|nr:ABC transporter permease [Proteiniborus sp. DW1]SCG83024.1 Oligopeptide transport system permease protein oppB [Proteiniborus sp. DW1]